MGASQDEDDHRRLYSKTKGYNIFEINTRGSRSKIMFTENL